MGGRKGLGVGLIALAVVVVAAPLSAPAASPIAHEAKAKCKKSKARAAKKKKKCKRPTTIVVPPGAAGPAGPSGPTDTVPPSINITSPMPLDITGSAGSGTFTVTGADNVICKIDGTPNPCDPGSGTFSFSALPEGLRTFRIDASDLAGNTAFASVTWTVDTTPPTISLYSVTGNGTNQTHVHFTVGENGALAEVRCVVTTNGVTLPSQTCVEDTSFAGLSSGPNSIEIYGIDSVGNSGEPFATATSGPTPHAHIDFTIP